MSYDVHLRTVARLADHTHFDVGKNEVVARKGPYPYYGDLFERFEVDDYGVEAPSVIFMSAAGQVLNADGGFRAALEHGRCGSNAFAHVVVAHDPADADYLFACLTTLPNAVDYIGGSNQLQTLDELAVLRLALPWPCRATRDAYVAKLAAADARVAAARDALRAARQACDDAERSQTDADGCATLARRRDEADSALDAEMQARTIMVRDFFEFGVLEGCDCAPVEPERVTGVFHYSDAKAEGARAEVAARAAEQARERGGLPVPPALHEALGALAPFVETRSFGLAAEDLAWELAPMAVVRACCAPERWAALAAEPDPAAALDAAIAELASAEPCFSLLPNLSYASSLLDAVQLGAWVSMLGAVDPAAITPSALRAVFDVAAGAPAVPADVAAIAAAVARGQLESGGEQGAYLPLVGQSGLFDALSTNVSGHPLTAQCADTPALLQLLLVRGVAVRGACSAVGAAAPVDACAPEASALLADAYPAVRAPFVLVDVPWQRTPWSPVPPDRADPRWVLGVPTRMRPAWAWVEQALAHLAPGGRAVALVSSRELQTTESTDASARRALVEQGRVQAVVALPPRIWGDGRPPASLLVLGGAGSADACLMVDATGLDAFDDEAVFGPDPQRALAPGAAVRVASLLTAWLFEGKAPQGSDAAAARVVARADLASNGCLLAPWLYAAGK